MKPDRLSKQNLNSFHLLPAPSTCLKYVCMYVSCLATLSSERSKYSILTYMHICDGQKKQQQQKVTNYVEPNLQNYKFSDPSYNYFLCSLICFRRM